MGHEQTITGELSHATLTRTENRRVLLGLRANGDDPCTTHVRDNECHQYQNACRANNGKKEGWLSESGWFANCALC